MKCIDYHKVELYCMRHCKTEVPLSVLNVALVEAEPVVHAHWVFVEKAEDYAYGRHGVYKCSECGRVVRHYLEGTVQQQYPYCHCGAKMGEEVKP